MATRNQPVPAYAAKITVPATETILGVAYNVNLNQAEVDDVQPVAERLGMTIDGLIRCYLSRGRPMKPTEKDAVLPVEHIAFASCATTQDKERLERAAKLYGETVEGFIAQAIACHIEAAEDAMLLHPHTKQLFGFDTFGDRLRREAKFTPCKQRKGTAAR